MIYSEITIVKFENYDVVYIPVNGRKGRPYHYFEVKTIIDNFDYFEREYARKGMPRGISEIRLEELVFDKEKIIFIYEQKQTLIDFLNKFKDKYDHYMYMED